MNAAWLSSSISADEKDIYIFSSVPLYKAEIRNPGASI